MRPISARIPRRSSRRSRRPPSGSRSASTRRTSSSSRRRRPNNTWASAGLQRGDDGDVWVRDAERLGTNRDTWIHEYVHTRQGYTTLEDGSDGMTPETRWTIEGLADYYGALLPYETGKIDFESFAERLEDVEHEKYGDVALADPATWEGTDADYDKGMAVFAHLDRRLRAEADTTLDAVVADLNDDGGELTQRRFLAAIESAGGDDVRADAERYTETTDVPPLPTRSEHVAAFGGPDVRYSIGALAVSGPYRNETIAESESELRLVTGETLAVNATVENVGTDAGEFEAALRIDDETVAAESGRLDPGEETTAAFAHRFDGPGEYEISVGSATRSVTVEEPAAIEVTDVAVEPVELAVGETATVRATVASVADRPAEGEVVFAVDGERIGVESVRIANGSRTVETSVSFEAAGERTVSANERSVTVTVRKPAETADGEADADPEPGPIVVDDQPGFGIALAVLAMSLLVLSKRRQ